MTRVKRGVIVGKRHKKILKMAQGYRGARSRVFKRAHEAVLHSGEYAFAGRKRRKREIRRLWISRINAAVGKIGVSYRDFINGLKKNKIELNRKILAELAVDDFAVFKKIVEEAKTVTKK